MKPKRVYFYLSVATLSIALVLSSILAKIDRDRLIAKVKIMPVPETDSWSLVLSWANWSFFACGLLLLGVALYKKEKTRSSVCVVLAAVFIMLKSIVF